MPAPLIGLSTYQETATWGPWRNVPAALLPNRYVESVTRVGGIPLLLPPHLEAHDAEALKAEGEQVVSVLDGLILTGGPDIDPVGYGAVRHLDTDNPRKDRDAWEYALLAAALDRDLPVLAICRGFQLLNAALGGTLRQHLPDEGFGHAHRQQLGQFAAVRIDLDPAAPPGRDLSAHIIAWCHHHQGIDKLGEGLQSTGNAPDGLIEAAWMPKKAFVVGVQWHPEEDSKPELFRSLTDAATRYAKGR